MRVILGISVGFIIVVANTLIADYFNGAERTAFFGIQVTLMSVGTVISTVLSGILADINWHLVFLIYSFGLVVMFFVYKFIFDPNVKKDSNKNDRYIHHNVVNDNVKKNVIVQNNFIIGMLLIISIFNMIAYYLIPLQLPFILYSLGSMNAKKVSIVLALETAIAAWFSLKHRRINKNHSFASICTFALFFMSLSYFIVVCFPNYLFILFSMILYGFGMGLMMPNNSLWIISITKPHNRGIVLGMLSTSIFLGKAISPFIVYFISKKMAVIKLFSIFAVFMLFVSVSVVFLNEYISSKNKKTEKE